LRWIMQNLAKELPLLQFKTVADPLRTGRFDNTVVYTNERFASKAAQLLKQFATQHPEYFNTQTPLFTKPIAQGISAAVEADPSSFSQSLAVSEQEASFGYAVIGQAMARAARRVSEHLGLTEQQKREEFDKELRDVLLKLGRDPEKPYLHLGSKDVFELPVAEVILPRAIALEGASKAYAFFVNQANSRNIKAALKAGFAIGLESGQEADLANAWLAKFDAAVKNADYTDAAKEQGLGAERDEIIAKDNAQKKAAYEAREAQRISAQQSPEQKYISQLKPGDKVSIKRSTGAIETYTYIETRADGSITLRTSKGEDKKIT